VAAVGTGKTAARVGEGENRIEISPSGNLQERREQMEDRRESATESTDHDMCKSLQKIMVEKSCSRRGVVLFQERRANLKVASTWPVNGCSLPTPIVNTHAETKSPCTVVFAASAQSIENIWALLPAGGVALVPLKAPLESSLVRTEGDDDPEGLIWQSLYQIHSSLYFPAEYGDSARHKLGLSDLQFARFWKGHALLQKADWSSDLKASNGTFWKLAFEGGTDKIDSFHNYSLLYHRHLDEAGVFQDYGSMMLEIGLGCTAGPGDATYAGASAKIWPRLFPKMAVHFIELDRECTANWAPVMRELGITKVHVGPQADPAVLSEIIRDSHSAQPGGFVSVIDDGSHTAPDIEASFKALFPHLKSGGLYFVEDIMYSAWPTMHSYRDLPGMKMRSKHDRTSANPIALAAVLAAAATGLADTHNVAAGTAEVLQELGTTTSPPTSKSFFGRALDNMHAAVSYLLEPFVARPPPPHTWPVASFADQKKWREEVLAASGAMVDLVECTPGICVFRRA